jgi:hypothetical protein
MNPNSNLPEFTYLKFYDLESYILTDVRKSFNRDKYLSAFDFFCIIIWKANRAKTKIAQRLVKINPDLNQCIRDLTNKIFEAPESKQKMKILMSDFGFRLPMASAILTILYSETFTVYDMRVCDTLCKFKGIDNITNFDNLWKSYQDYISCVKAYEPTNLSLRDKDRYLWGKSFHKQLTSDLKNNFQKTDSILMSDE